MKHEVGKVYPRLDHPDSVYLVDGANEDSLFSRRLRCIEVLSDKIQTK